jgi:low affinity Fe/Cu permease
MPKFSPPTRGELVVKLFPRFVGTVLSFAGVTIVFGILLALALNNENPAQFSFTGPWALRVMIGASVAFVVFLLGLLVVRPSVKKMSRILTEMQASNQPQPPPEFVKLQKRVEMVANVALVLLVFTLVFMVSAAEL